MQSQVLRGVVQFLIYRIENEYLSILFQIILGGEVGSWSDLCFAEIYSSIIFYWFIGSRDELFLICHQFVSYIHFIIFNTLW